MKSLIIQIPERSGNSAVVELAAAEFSTDAAEDGMRGRVLGMLMFAFKFNEAACEVSKAS